jgi:hypothetical protein
MHKKYAKDGLVAITLNLDPLSEGEGADDKSRSADITARALKFLREKGATGVNLLLDAPTEFWQEKFGFAAPPTLFVFDRQGRWVRFKSDDDSLKVDAKTHHYPEVEALVRKLLAEK